MSHINSKEKLLSLRKYLTGLEEERPSLDTIEGILNEIVPKCKNGKNMVGLIVNDSDTRAEYLPYQNTIVISRDQLSKSSKSMAKILENEADLEDVKNLPAYYILFALLHETEHSFQFMIAKDIIPFKYNIVKEGYKNIINAIRKNPNNKPNPLRSLKQLATFYKYEKRRNDYILERNATNEAARDIKEIALADDREDIASIFDLFIDAENFNGYEKDNRGCMYVTHRNLWLTKAYNAINKDEEISLEDRIRFGLEIDDKSRMILLRKIIK